MTRLPPAVISGDHADLPLAPDASASSDESRPSNHRK